MRKTQRPASDFAAVAPSLHDNLITKARASGSPPPPAKAPAPALPGEGPDQTAVEEAKGEEDRASGVEAEERKRAAAAANQKADEVLACRVSGVGRVRVLLSCTSFGCYGVLTHLFQQIPPSVLFWGFT